MAAGMGRRLQIDIVSHWHRMRSKSVAIPPTEASVVFGGSPGRSLLILMTAAILSTTT
jgi:hypothetical protein